MTTTIETEVATSDIFGTTVNFRASHKNIQVMATFSVSKNSIGQSYIPHDDNEVIVFVGKRRLNTTINWTPDTLDNDIEAIKAEIANVVEEMIADAA